jgi:hypothetical protein
MADRSPTSAAKEGSEPVVGLWPEVTAPTPIEERQVFPGEGRELLDRCKPQDE